MMLFLSTADEGSERFLGVEEAVLVIDPFVGPAQPLTFQVPPERNSDARSPGPFALLAASS
jgi:hypothetical protein